MLELDLEVELISIKAACGKDEYAEHTHSKVCWSGEKFHSQTPGSGEEKVEGMKACQSCTCRATSVLSSVTLVGDGAPASMEAEPACYLCVHLGGRPKYVVKRLLCHSCNPQLSGWRR